MHDLLWNEDLRRQIRRIKSPLQIHEGVYAMMTGPNYETPAEIRMFQIIGGTAVGMSTVPETILARRYGLKVAGLSVITNLAAGIEGASPSHEETKREGAKAAENMTKLITRFLSEATLDKVA